MSEIIDVIIVGAGVNGCAIARQLSLEGKRVVLLECNEIGCGTSSNSSKLIHGGLRYLENMQFAVVQESLKDRKRLLEMYPDLVEMVPFYLPVYKGSLRPCWMIRTGLGLYDLFSRQPEYHCRTIANDDFFNKFSGIKSEGLKKVYVYYDGKTNDLKLTQRLAQDASSAGCMIQEHCLISAIELADDGIEVSCEDKDGKHYLKAPLLINATGPWIDEVNNMYGLPHNYRIAKVSGIHIVIDRKLVPDCMFLQTENKRIFFMIPWEEDKTIIGTTERMESGRCDEVQINQEDIEYLIECANHYLNVPIKRGDICDTFLGIRPLVMDKNAPDATSMSREYKIDVVSKGKSKVIHVYGGKLTTCLSMAEKVATRI